MAIYKIHITRDLDFILKFLEKMGVAFEEVKPEKYDASFVSEVKEAREEYIKGETHKKDLKTLWE